MLFRGGPLSGEHRSIPKHLTEIKVPILRQRHGESPEVVGSYVYDVFHWDDDEGAAALRIEDHG